MGFIETFDFPDDLKYDRTEHLWLRSRGDHVLIGLDSLSLEALGNVVHVEVREIGTVFKRGEDIGSLEAEKMVSSLVAPVDGTIVARNEDAIGSPGGLRADPYGAGWLVEIEADDPGSVEPNLVTGDEAIRDWATAEVARYVENGWVA